MKQVVQDVRSGETSVIEVPVPMARPGTALVRTAASLVSAGTERAVVEFSSKSLIGKARKRPDLVRQVLDKVRREGLLTTFEAVQNRLDQPMPLGYSSAGTVVAVGDGLQGFRVGDRVACAGGGYAVHAEYAIVPQNLLAHLPQGVDFEAGAFATLGAIALHGFRLAEAQIGERVAVIGLGLLGLLSVGIARAAGCAVFGVDPDLERVERAKAFGATAVTNPNAAQAAAAFSQGQGCDVVLICADTQSNDPVELAGAIARDRARVVAIGAVGMDIPRRTYYQKELQFIVSRSYGPGRYDPLYEEAGIDYPLGYVRWTEGRNLAAFMETLTGGTFDVAPLISHHFDIQQARQAYDLIRGVAAGSFLGVILTYPQEEKIAGKDLHSLEFEEGQISPSANVRLGAIGAGNFATVVLFPALRKVKGIERVGLLTASGLKAAQMGKRFGFHYATTALNEILDDERINTIAVLTRHHLHASQVVAALNAGKHVFCEKPLALDRDELSLIIHALDQSDRMLTVGFNRRFSPFAVRLKEFFGAVDEPLAMNYRVNAGYLPQEHWLHNEQGGGRIIGEACHFIDFLTFINGSASVCVSAVGMPDDRRYHEDNVVITLDFPDGSIGTISYLAAGDRAFPKERVEVIGGGRVAVLDDFRRIETFHNGRRKVHRAWLHQEKGHRQEWQAFVDAIAAGGPPPIPYEHLIGVSISSIAAVEALRSRTPTKIEPLPRA